MSLSGLKLLSCRDPCLIANIPVWSKINSLPLDSHPNHPLRSPTLCYHSPKPQLLSQSLLVSIMHTALTICLVPIMHNIPKTQELTQAYMDTHGP